MRGELWEMGIRNTSKSCLDMNAYRAAINWSIMEKICFEVTFQLIK